MRLNAPLRARRVKPPVSQPRRTPAPTDAADACCTRSRLLEAAGEVFAERGYRDATVREICTRAGANIAAVNYYFQGKDGLYTRVVDYAQGCMQSAYPLQIDASLPLEQRLAQFVRAFLVRVLDDTRPAWHWKMMLREIADPTPALDRVVQGTIRPTMLLLGAILRDLLPGAEDHEVRLAAASIVGQCLHYRHARPVMERLFPGQKFGPSELDLLAGHITRFSLGGLRAMSEGTRKEGKKEGAGARPGVSRSLGSSVPSSSRRRARR